MKSTGKRFEEQFKKSVPKDAFYYRFRDGTANFNNNRVEGIRFQQKNMCDAEIFKMPVLFLFELKSTKQASLSFSSIRDNQSKELLKAMEYDGICSGFVVNFSEKDKCYFVYADKVKAFIDAGERKSIPIVWFEENGIEIGIIKKRVNNLYKLDVFIDKIIQEIKEKTNYEQ